MTFIPNANKSAAKSVLLGAAIDDQPKIRSSSGFRLSTPWQRRRGIFEIWQQQIFAAQRRSLNRSIVLIPSVTPTACRPQSPVLSVNPFNPFTDHFLPFLLVDHQRIIHWTKGNYRQLHCKPGREEFSIEYSFY